MKKEEQEDRFSYKFLKDSLLAIGKNKHKKEKEVLIREETHGPKMWIVLEEKNEEGKTEYTEYETYKVYWTILNTLVPLFDYKSKGVRILGDALHLGFCGVFWIYLFLTGKERYR